jgi:rhodanese-related sulfurtransferase
MPSVAFRESSTDGTPPTNRRSLPGQKTGQLMCVTIGRFPVSVILEVKDFQFSTRSTEIMSATMEATRTITPQELNEMVERGESLDLIDVRTPVEFREVHVSYAKNVPLDRLNAGEIKEARAGSDRPLYVICRSGNRSKQACDKLVAAGCGDVVNVEGGTNACVEAGLPVVRGKKAISLERQVRIVAGLMSMIGIAGYFYNEWFLVLPAMVGVGMFFAGVTDTCGMGLLLGRMPWNQVKCDNGTSCKA